MAKRFSDFILAVFFFLLVTITARQYLQFKAKAFYKAKVDEMQGAIDEIHPRFATDIKILESFPKPGRTSDAGVKLNDWVSWSKQAAPRKQGFTQWVKDPQALKVLTEKVGLWKGQWIDHLNEIQLDQLNLAWIAQLSSFDYWELGNANPVKEALKTAPDMHPREMTAPDALELEAWGMARLASGLRTKKIVEAVNEVSQLALLMFSTESPRVVHSALNLWQKINEALKAGNTDRSQTKSVVSPEQIAALERVGEASPLFLSEMRDGEMLSADYKPSSGWNPALCVSINIEIEFLMRDRVLLRHAPDVDFGAIDDLIRSEQTGCRIPQARHLWNQVNLVPEWLRVRSFAIPQEFPYSKIIQGLKWSYKMSPPDALLPVFNYLPWFGPALAMFERENAVTFVKKRYPGS